MVLDDLEPTTLWDRDLMGTQGGVIMPAFEPAPLHFSENKDGAKMLKRIVASCCMLCLSCGLQVPHRHVVPSSSSILNAA